MDFIDDFFQEGSAVKAISKDGVDITEEFYHKNIGNYVDKNYGLIAKDFYNTLSSFEKTTIKHSLSRHSLSRSTSTQNVRQDYYVNGKTTKLTANTTYDIGFYTSMSFNYDNSSGTIISYTKPSVTVVSGPNVGAAYDADLVSASATASKVNSVQIKANTTVKIKVSFLPEGFLLGSETITINKTAYFGT